jgi:hypothetical protein
METIVKIVDKAGQITETTTQETWAKLTAEYKGKEVVVKTIQPRTAGNNFPSAFSIRGVLEIGTVQARVVNRSDNDDNYVYFTPAEVEVFVPERLSDSLPGIQLRGFDRV